MSHEIRSKIWELCYGLLEESEAVELRKSIRTDPKLARLYSRVKLETELLAQAATATNIHWHSPEPSGFKVARAKRLLGKRATFLARIGFTATAAAIAASLLVAASVAYWSDDSPFRESMLAQTYSDLKNASPRLLVTGPAELRAGQEATYEVLVRRLDEQPVDAEVTAAMRDSHGETFWRENVTTNSEGLARLHLPAELPSVQCELAVEARPIDRLEHFTLTEGTTSSTFADQAKMSTWLSVVEPPQPRQMAIDRYAAVNGDVFERQAILGSKPTTRFDVGSQRAGGAVLAKPVARAKDAAAQETDQFSSPPTATERLSLRDSEGSFGELASQDSVRLSKLTRFVVEPGRNELAEVAVGRALPVPLVANDSPPRDTAEQPGAEIPQLDAKEESPGAAEISDVAATKSPAPNETVANEPSAKSSYENSAHENLGLPAKDSLVVEATLMSDGGCLSRFIVGREGEPSLATKDEAKSGLDGPQSSSHMARERLFFDYSVAPPQPLASEKIQREDAEQEVLEPSVKLKASADKQLAEMPVIRTLNIDAHFDASQYRLGERVSVELSVVDEHNSPVPATLGVSVEIMNTTEAADNEGDVALFANNGRAKERVLTRDNALLPQHELISFVPANQFSRSLPLVYDNAVFQEAKLRQSIESWMVSRRAKRDYWSALLLLGSGLGYAVLLLAALLKVLPTMRAWVPIAVPLACCSVVGVTWMMRDDTPPPTPNVKSLVTYGVSPEPVAPSKSSDTDGIPHSLANSSATPAARSRAEWSAFSLNPLTRSSDANAAKGGATFQLPDVFTLDALAANWRDEAKSPENSWAKIDDVVAAIDSNSQEDERFYFDQKGKWDFGVHRFDDKRMLNHEDKKSDEKHAEFEKLHDQPERDLAETRGETIYLHPLLQTAADGKATAQFELPAKPFACRLSVIAHHADQYGRDSFVVPVIVPMSAR